MGAVGFVPELPSCDTAGTIAANVTLLQLCWWSLTLLTSACRHKENNVIKRLVLVLLLLAVLFGAIFGWKYLQMQQQMAGRGGPPPAVVSTRTVMRESWQPALKAVGSIAPVRGVVISAEVPGVIRKIHFDSSDRVSDGELLVEFDIEVDLAELAALRADRRLAEITRDRLARIVTQNLGSRSDLDEAQAALDHADAEIAAKEAMIRKKAVRAPFAGELGIRRINPGQYLQEGDTIADLVALDPVYAEYALPERFLAELVAGQPVTVRVQSYPDRVFEGKIYAVSPYVQPASRSVVVRALIANPDRQLRPGMFAEVETLQSVREDVLTLPERAVTYNTYGESVFVVEEADGGRTVRLVQIETGDVRNGRIEIKRGLEAGIEVVSDGHNKLRNGQSISIDNSVDPDATDPRA
jgi:membrane fusion protein (multidrug efflux system)